MKHELRTDQVKRWPFTSWGNDCIWFNSPTDPEYFPHHYDTDGLSQHRNIHVRIKMVSRLVFVHTECPASGGRVKTSESSKPREETERDHRHNLPAVRTRRWNKETHPPQLVDVLFHRESVQSAGDAEKRSQKSRSETQLQRHRRQKKSLLSHLRSVYYACIRQQTMHIIVLSDTAGFKCVILMI